MKRFIALFLVITYAFNSVMTSIVVASSGNDISIFIDGTEIKTESRIKNSLLLVPLRVVAEKLRCKVEWIGEKKLSISRRMM